MQIGQSINLFSPIKSNIFQTAVMRENASNLTAKDGLFSEVSTREPVPPGLASPLLSSTRLNSYTVPHADLFPDIDMSAWDILSHDEWINSLPKEIRLVLDPMGTAPDIPHWDAEARIGNVKSAISFLKELPYINARNEKRLNDLQQVATSMGFTLRASSWSDTPNGYTIALFENENGERKIFMRLSDESELFFHVPSDFSDRDFSEFLNGPFARFKEQHNLTTNTVAASRLKMLFEEFFTEMFPQPEN